MKNHKKYSTQSADRFFAEKYSAGSIQAQVDLQQLARVLLDEGMPGGDAVSYINPFDPDDCTGSLLIFKNYYRDVRSGDRGGAIKFIQRVRRCSYGSAIAFIEGWLLALEAVR